MEKSGVEWGSRTKALAEAQVYEDIGPLKEDVELLSGKLGR